jgi:hypothetical protein
MGEFFSNICSGEDNIYQVNLRRSRTRDRIPPKDLDFLDVPDIISIDLGTIDELP